MKFQLKWTVCRVCLKDGEELSTIFEKDETEQMICDKIMECAGITISREANLPEKICKKCTAFLSVAYKFRTICKHSDEILQSFIDKKLDSKILPGFTVEGEEEEGSETDCEILEDPAHDENTGTERKLLLDNIDPTDSFLNNDDSDQSDTVHEEDASDIKYNLETFEIIEVPENIEKKNPLNKMRMRSSKRATTPTRTTPSKTLAMDTDGTPIIKYRNLDEKPSHICEICGNIYKMRHSLDIHMRWHRKEKPYDCEICGVAFGLNSQLTRHMRVHTGQKPYECRHCGRKFSDIGTKNKHERIHTGERPFKCDTCGKSFSYSHVLNVHLLTHTGEKRYSCNQCGKRFSQAHHLKAHLSTLTHQKIPLPSSKKTSSRRISAMSKQALNSKHSTDKNNRINIDESPTSNTDDPNDIDLNSNSVNDGSNSIILKTDIIQVQSSILDGSNNIHLLFTT